MSDPCPVPVFLSPDAVLAGARSASPSLSPCAPQSVLDPRASLPAERVHYPHLHAFRSRQAAAGVDTLSLSDTQWGLVPLDKCHHISTAASPAVSFSHTPHTAHTQSHTQAAGSPAESLSVSLPESDSSPTQLLLTTPPKSSPTHHTSPKHNNPHTQHTPLPGLSFRVRICKTCCHEANHIELGTYVDQESAVLVNDAHEILARRADRLLVLRKEDAPYLHWLHARKYDRCKGRDFCKIVDLLSERFPSSAVGCHVSGNGEVNTTVNGNNGNNYPLMSPLRAAGSSPEMSTRKRKSPGEYAALLSRETERDRESERERERAITWKRDRERDRESKLGSSPTQRALTTHTQDTGSLSLSVSLSRSPARELKRQRSYTFSTAADFAPQSFFAPSAPLQALNPLAWLATIASEEADCVSSLFALHNAPLSLCALDEEREGEGEEEDEKSERESAVSLSVALPQSETKIKSSEKEREREEEALCDAKTESDGESESEDAPASLLTMVEYFSTRKTAEDENSPHFVDPYASNALSFYGSNSGFNGSIPNGSMDRLSLLTSSAVFADALPLLVPLPPHNAVSQSALRSAAHTHAHAQAELPPTRRGRSNSMSVIESSLGSFGSSRAKDPLSIALRKYIERGGPGDGFIGIYSPEDRKARLQRFQEKRKHRLWTKKVKYDVRKNFADSRIRIKGRFVKKDEEQAVLSLVMRSTLGGAPAEEDEEFDEEDEDEGDEHDVGDGLERLTNSSSSSSAPAKRRLSSLSSSGKTHAHGVAMRKAIPAALGVSLPAATTPARRPRANSMSSTTSSSKKRRSPAVGLSAPSLSASSSSSRRNSSKA